MQPTESSMPLIKAFNAGTTANEFINWYKLNAGAIDRELTETGAILFRGLPITSLEVFSEIVGSISDKFLRYVDGFSPRTKLTSNVYTSTEYDADFYITLHSELSYSAKWPSRIFFSCIIPAETGGETPIADCRRIVREMRPELLEELERKGVRYIRNLHGGGGVGPSWQETYETDSREEVERFCRESNIEFYWKEDGGIKLVQNKPATILHPITGERVWFNQVDQFHPSQFNQDIYETLMLMYDGDEEKLPMFGSYGDGSKISLDAVQEIRRTVDGARVLTPWQQGDLLLVDNVLVCHGRMPYTGSRKVLVSMS